MKILLDLLVSLHPKEIKQKFNYQIVPFTNREKHKYYTPQIRNCLNYGISLFYIEYLLGH